MHGGLGSGVWTGGVEGGGSEGGTMVEGRIQMEVFFRDGIVESMNLEGDGEGWRCVSKGFTSGSTSGGPRGGLCLEREGEKAMMHVAFTGIDDALMIMFSMHSAWP